MLLEKKSIKSAMSVLTMSFSCFAGMVLADDCQMQISQPVLDYGSVNPDVLRANNSASDTAPLGKRYAQLYVLCSEPRTMAIGFRGIASGVEAYQLSDRGSFDVTLKDVKLDGAPVLAGIVSSIGEVPATSANAVKLAPGKYFVPVISQQLITGKALSMKVEIDTRLATDQLKVRDVVMLDGRGFFELQ